MVSSRQRRMEEIVDFIRDAETQLRSFIQWRRRLPNWSPTETKILVQHLRSLEDAAYGLEDIGK